MTLPPSTLVYQPHPLMRGGRQLVEVTLLPGESLLAFFERALPEVAVHDPRLVWVASIADRRVPRAMWARTFPKPGMIITLTAAVHGGGGGGGKSPIQTVLSLGLMLIAPGIGGGIANALGFTGANATFAMFGFDIAFKSVFTGLVNILGNALIARIFTPNTPALAEASGRGPYSSGAATSPTYALSGGSNRARPYAPLPLVLGKHVLFPDYGAKFYTEFEGDDQYLYQVFHCGFAPLVLSDFKIGSTPIASFTDVQIQESGDDGVLTLFPANVDTVAGGVLTNAAGWITRTSSIDATAIAVEIGGDLYSVGSGIGGNSVTIEMEYRAVGAGSWLPLLDAGAAVTITNASRKPVRQTYRREVLQGQYEVRARRTSADDTADTAISNMSWTQLRTYQPDQADYTGQKRVAVRIKASGQLNGQLEQFNCIASRLVETWNGSAWVVAETSNPAWLVRHFAKGVRIAGKVAYGGDLSDTQIGEANIKAFGTWCASKNLTFNAVFDSPRTCAEVLDLIARCGRGRTTWPNGKLECVWDVPNQPAVAVFGLGNIRRDSFEVEYFSGVVPEQVVGRFVNPARDWQQDEVRANVPGITTPAEVAVMDLFGMTDQDMAGREVALAAGAYSTQLRRIVFETDGEGTTVTGGDVAVLAHDLTQWGYSGRLLSGTGSVLQLDRAVPFTAGLQHYVRIVAPSGFHTIMDVVYQAGSSDTITLASALPATDGLGNAIYTPDTDPKHPPIDWQWAFEPRATPGKLVKIIGAEPRRGGWRFTCVDETETYYAGEYGAWEGSSASGDEGPVLANLTIAEALYAAGNGFNVRLALLWDTLGDYELAIVRLALDGGPMEEKTRTYGRRTEVDVPSSGTVDIEIIGFGPGGKTGTRSKLTQSGYVILGKAYPPPEPTGFTVDGDTMRWRVPTVPDLAGFVLRYNLGDNRNLSEANRLFDGIITENAYRLNPRPAGLMTLFLTSIDTSGIESTPAIVVINLGDVPVANVVETFDFEALGWPGTITGGAIAGVGIEASSTALFYTGNPDAQVYTGDPSALVYAAANYALMVYEASPIYPGTALQGSQLTLPNTVTGDGVVIEHRTLGSGPFYSGIGGAPMYTGVGGASLYDPLPDYQPWLGSVAATSAHQFRVTVAGGEVQGAIDTMTATVDVPDVEEVLGNVAISAGGTRLPITKTYNTIQAVSLTLLDDGGAATTARVMDKSATLGPLVQCFNSVGAAVAGHVDANPIKGY